MYAVIETGGKQYRVSAGDVVFLEKLAKEAGDEVTFEKVLAVSDAGKASFGNPYLEGASVAAKVLGHGKDPKIVIFKYKAKKGYRKKQGHRQPYTKVQISSVVPGAASGIEPEDYVAPEVETVEAEVVEPVAAAKDAEKAPKVVDVAAEDAVEAVEAPEAEEGAAADASAEAPEDVSKGAKE